MFIKKADLLDVWELSATGKATQLSAGSSHDSNPNDQSAESVFEMGSVTTDPGKTRLFISQGDYGVEELTLR